MDRQALIAQLLALPALIQRTEGELIATEKNLAAAKDFLAERESRLLLEEETAKGALPLSPLTRVAETELPRVIRRMEERVAQEASPAQAGILWTATLLLMGLRFTEETAARLLQGVRGMKESTTYQMILREGRVEGRVEAAQAILLRLGTKRFGTPPDAARALLEGITDVQRLETLSERLLDVESWDELLAD